MSLFAASLNSGSNGNCYYIGNDREAILIDAGISCRETEKRMTNLGLSMKRIKAIFISHEHSDHINGVVTLSRKYKLPVYITPATLRKSSIQLENEIIKSFKVNQALEIGGLAVTAFEKFHDAIEPCSFIVEGNGTTVGVFTDIGIACKQVIHYFKQCNAVFLEANYDEKMLEGGTYPAYLKKRIKSSKGHLSNMQALELFMQHKPDFLSHLFLSHLSKDNNCPLLVSELFTRHATHTEIIVASRFKETPVYQIFPTENKVPKIKKAYSQLQAVQMSMFD